MAVKVAESCRVPTVAPCVSSFNVQGVLLARCCHFPDFSGNAFTAILLHTVLPAKKNYIQVQTRNAQLFSQSPSVEQTSRCELCEHLMLQKQLGDEQLPGKYHWEIPLRNTTVGLFFPPSPSPSQWMKK